MSDDGQRSKEALMRRCDALEAEVTRLRDENARLRIVVGRLPKTTDGVPYTIGRWVWLDDEAFCVEEIRITTRWSWDVRIANDEVDRIIVEGDGHLVYSTQEAARKGASNGREQD